MRKIVKKDKAQGLVEYGLILALVSVVAVGSLKGVGGKVNDTFGHVFDGSSIVENEAVTYSVTFKDHEGVILETIEVKEGGSVVAPEGPEREGYTFTGWSDSFEQVTGDMVITPVYEANIYTVTFKDEFGTVLGQEVVAYGENVSAPVLEGSKGEYFTLNWDGSLAGVSANQMLTGTYQVKPAYTNHQVVRTASELQAINNNNTTRAQKYIQVGDIDLSSISNFNPIGDNSNPFRGEYIGGGFEIRDLVVDHGDYAGLFGKAEGATFKNIALIDVDVNGIKRSGSLVGHQTNSSITNSYATGNVTGVSDVTGGLVGLQTRSSTIMSYAVVNVRGDSNTGGLIGHQQYNSSTINCYSTGDVRGISAGGLIGGQFESSVANSYAIGKVTVTSGRAGGLVGYNQKASNAGNSYFDKVTAGTSYSDGGIGKTTSQMKQQNTFNGWDFTSIWQIKPGEYPTLR